MRPYPPDTAPMPAPTVAPPATHHEAVARALLALATAQDEREPPVRLGVLRGEAARAVEEYSDVLPRAYEHGSAQEAHNIEVRTAFLTLRGSAPIPSATLLTWAAGWRALAGSL